MISYVVIDMVVKMGRGYLLMDDDIIQQITLFISIVHLFYTKTLVKHGHTKPSLYVCYFPIVCFNTALLSNKTW